MKHYIKLFGIGLAIFAVVGIVFAITNGDLSLISFGEVLAGLLGLAWVIANAVYVWYFKPWKTFIFLLIDFAIISMAVTEGNIFGSFVLTPLFAIAAVIPFHKGFEWCHLLLGEEGLFKPNTPLFTPSIHDKEFKMMMGTQSSLTNFSSGNISTPNMKNDISTPGSSLHTAYLAYKAASDSKLQSLENERYQYEVKQVENVKRMEVLRQMVHAMPDGEEKTRCLVHLKEHDAEMSKINQERELLQAHTQVLKELCKSQEKDILFQLNHPEPLSAGDKHVLDFQRSNPSLSYKEAEYMLWKLTGGYHRK